MGSTQTNQRKRVLTLAEVKDAVRILEVVNGLQNNDGIWIQKAQFLTEREITVDIEYAEDTDEFVLVVE